MSNKKRSIKNNPTAIVIILVAIILGVFFTSQIQFGGGDININSDCIEYCYDFYIEGSLCWEECISVCANLGPDYIPSPDCNECGCGSSLCNDASPGAGAQCRGYAGTCKSTGDFCDDDDPTKGFECECQFDATGINPGQRVGESETLP